MGIVRIPAITSTREWPLAESAWHPHLGAGWAGAGKAWHSHLGA